MNLGKNMTAQTIGIGHDIVTLSSFLVERLHQRGSVGELIDGRVMTAVMKNPLGQREVNEPCSNLPFGHSF